MKGPGYASIIFSGESRTRTALRRKSAQRQTACAGKGSIRKRSSARRKRSMAGTIAALNSVDNIANSMASFAFAGRELYTYIDDLANATLESVQKRLEEQLDPAYSALSVVYPVE